MVSQYVRRFDEAVADHPLMKCLAFVLVALIATVVLPTAFGQAKSPATNSVAVIPQSDVTVDSMAMAMQVVGQLARCVTNRELASIHNEDLFLSAALTAFRTNSPAGADKESFKADLVGFGLSVSQLHTAADAGNQGQSISELTVVKRAFDAFKKHFPQETIAAAESRASRFVCPMHPDAIGKRVDLCPKCGMELDQQLRLLPYGLGNVDQRRATVRAAVRTLGPLEVGHPVRCILELRQEVNGMPVLLSDLVEAHTEKIHLLIVDPSLKDYHHKHPRPTATPGEYSFTFTPSKPGNYRVWADLRPRPMGLQEYAVTDIQAGPSGLAPGQPEPLTDRSLVTNVVVDGLRYELFLPKEAIKAARTSSARLRITETNGEPFTRLEPVMATFAHLVGFNEDYQTVLHMHPMGPPVLRRSERGGPELEFQIYALRPGFVRLFAQVQIGGVQRFAPFGIQVSR